MSAEPAEPAALNGGVRLQQELELRRDEAAVEVHSASLKRELGLSDLVFTQILFIVGLPWVGVAAKQGPSHVIFWLVAMAAFSVPSALVVIHLNRRMPLEGGLYQWAKLGFNELTGFMVAWNLWPESPDSPSDEERQYLAERRVGNFLGQEMTRG